MIARLLEIFELHLGVPMGVPATSHRQPVEPDQGPQPVPPPGGMPPQ